MELSEKLEGLKDMLIEAKLGDASIERVLSDSMNSRLSLHTVAAILKNKHVLFDRLVASASDLNEKLFKREIEFYAVSYIADLCVNDCSYCGHKSSLPQKRELLSEEDIEKDFASILKFGPSEICILTGEHQSVTPEYLATAASIAIDADTTKSLKRVSFNVAPMTVENFRKILSLIDKPSDVELQFRIFQESYDLATYSANHNKGPKRDFDFRLGAQERAFEAGFDQVGIGAMMGLNLLNEPYRHFGNDLEILSLIVHAHHLNEKYGKFPSTLSIPRHKAAPGNSFETPNAVDDLRYIAYHAILRIALPNTRLIITNRESSEIMDVIRPFANIEDLAAKPGVGGNYRCFTHFQNRLGTDETPESRIRNVMDKGYIPLVSLRN